jgi:hypothetical protein
MEIDRLIADEQAALVNDADMFAPDSVIGLNQYTGIMSDEMDPDRVFDNILANADDRKLAEHLTIKLWNDTCTFFRRHPNDLRSESKFAYLRRGIRPHQLMAAFWSLKHSFCTRGGFIADEQGLGKTTISLFVASLLGFIEFMVDDFVENANLHLTARTQTHESKCTRAIQCGIPFQCLCEANFPHWLRKLLQANFTPRGFQVFVVPPIVITNWKIEFWKMFDSNFIEKYPHSAHFKLYIAHGIAKGTEKLAGKELKFKLLQDESTKRVRQGQCCLLVLTTPLSFPTQLLEFFTHKVKVQQSARKFTMQTVRDPFQISALYVDECHLRKNEKGAFFTDVVNARKDFLSKAVLFPMSGTAWEKGPGDLTGYVNFWTEAWSAALNTATIAHPDNPLSWKVVTDAPTNWSKSKNYRTLLHVMLDCLDTPLLQEIRNTIHTCNSNAVAKLHRQIDQLCKDLQSAHRAGDRVKLSLVHRRLEERGLQFATLISSMMIRRTGHTTFFDNKPLVKLPPLEAKDVPVEPTDPATIQLLKDIKTNLVQDLANEYSTKLAYWKSNGARPNQKPAEPNQRAVRMLNVHRPLVSFPALRAMLATSGGPFKSLTIDALADANAFDDIGGPDDVFNDYLESLGESSFRYKALRTEVFKAVSEAETLANGKMK